MRRTKTFLGVVVMMAATLVAFAAPAMANDHNDWDWNDRHDKDWWWDNRFDRFDVFDFDQEAESGDIDQDFDVSNTGDNSNQTAGIQGVANTGNAQNQIGVFDSGNGFDDDGDFEFDDVGSSIEVSPTNVTSSDQEVNQAASAFDR
jgi:hypothetical protein